MLFFFFLWIFNKTSVTVILFFVNHFFLTLLACAVITVRSRRIFFRQLTVWTQFLLLLFSFVFSLSSHEFSFCSFYCKLLFILLWWNLFINFITRPVSYILHTTRFTVLIVFEPIFFATVYTFLLSYCLGLSLIMTRLRNVSVWWVFEGFCACTPRTYFVLHFVGVVTADAFPVGQRFLLWLISHLSFLSRIETWLTPI